MCKVSSMSVRNRTFRVADIKQKYMHNIVDAADKCDIIQRVVLFGSSIEERCKETSDIDLAVFGTQVPSRALTSKKYERFARQLYFKTGATSKSSIMDDINRGEIVYERQSE